MRRCAQVRLNKIGKIPLNVGLTLIKMVPACSQHDHTKTLLTALVVKIRFEYKGGGVLSV